MKKKYIAALLCFIMCLSIALPAAAEIPLSAKQILLNSVQKQDFPKENKFYDGYTGTFKLEIESLKGDEEIVDEVLKKFDGFKISANSKFNPLERKIGLDYSLSLMDKQCAGTFYMYRDKIILSTGIIQLLVALFPDVQPLSSFDKMPDYVYTSDPEMSQLWTIFNRSGGRTLTPETAKLMSFILEAVPEKYYSFSLADQKIILDIDNEGLADIIYSVFNKIDNEKERFATIITGIATVISPDSDSGFMKREILHEIEEGFRYGDYPESPEAVAEGMDGLEVEKLCFEFPLLPGGSGKNTAIFKIDDEAGGKDQLDIMINTRGGQSNLSGDFDISLSVKDQNSDADFTLKFAGGFNNSPTEIDYKGTLSVNAKELSSNKLILDLIMKVNQQTKAAPNIPIDIPVLNPSNSTYMEDLFSSVEGEEACTQQKINIVVDKETVAFDAAPYMDSDRIMVPLRSLAEALGCEVVWAEPDNITVKSVDKTINLYVDQKYCMVNGVKKEMDTAPAMKGDKVFVPLRFLAEELGCDVQYDGSTATVYISSVLNSEN